MMKHQPIGHSVVIIFSALLLIIGYYFLTNYTQRSFTPDTSLGLVRPVFVEAVKAQGLDLAAKLDQEAGISAYLHSSDSITLDQIRSGFRTIEEETAEYIIGSVAITNYPEVYDAHVYANVDGWILAYYLNTDPNSKLIDIRNRTVINTTLRSVLATIAGLAGIPLSDITYYDFRFPNATNLIIVGEDNVDGKNFTVNMPSDFGYSERGWAALKSTSCGGAGASFTLNGTTLPATWSDANSSAGQGGSAYGSISSAQLVPDTTHTFALSGCSSYAALIITYRVP